MNLKNLYDRFIKSKPNKITLLIGQSTIGKTTSLILRLLYLKNNYCFSKNDKILLTSVSEENIKKLYKSYKNIEEVNHRYDTLFSFLSNEPCVLKIDELVEEYFNKYANKNNKKLKPLKDEELQIKIIRACVEKIKDNYKRVKIFKDNKIGIILSEIKWIKNCNYKALEDYKNAPKHNGITKNSKAREGIFKVKEMYDEEIQRLGYISYEDMLQCAAIQGKLKSEFVHILIDDSEKLTPLQWQFLKSIQRMETYSSLTLVFNRDKAESVYSNFIKNGRVYASRFEEKVKKFNIKDTAKISKEKNNIKENKVINLKDAFEKFKYFDLRHKTDFVMMKDYSSSDEIIVNDDEEILEYSKEDVTKIPVYTNIAAGEPILIDPSLEDNFSMPKQWIKGLKDCFILKVKGDSMINANINDGDYVVIHKQMDVNHNDIVAANISGSATLKRLNISKDGVFLMPENEKYKPIPVMEEGIFILGKAVGIIRQMYNNPNH